MSGTAKLIIYLLDVEDNEALVREIGKDTSWLIIPFVEKALDVS